MNGDVRWLAELMRRVCLMVVGAVEQRYPDMKQGPVCHECGARLTNGTARR